MSPARMTHQKSFQEAAHADEDDRDERQRLVHFVEDFRYIGHDEGDQEEQDDTADEKHEERVGERRSHATFQGLLLFAEIGKPLQHEMERARGFPRPDHVQVEGWKDLGVVGHGVREAVALVHFLPDLGKDALQLRMGRLRDQRRQRLDQRQPGSQKGCQLPCHDGDFPGPHLPEEAHCGHFQGAVGFFTRSFLKVDQVDVAIAQFLPGRGSALRVNDPLELLSLVVQGCILVNRHNRANLQTFCQLLDYNSFSTGKSRMQPKHRMNP